MKNLQVKMRIPEPWMNKILKRCEIEGIPLQAPGRSSGASEWIKRLIAKELGETMIDTHDRLSNELKGRPNPAHPANVRLWLATKRLKTSGNQMGFPLTVASAEDFLSHFQINVSDFIPLCDLSMTPDKLFSEEEHRGADWDGWQVVAAEVHSNNCLGLPPGFYKTPLSPNDVLRVYGREAFCPQTLTYERAKEFDDWIDQGSI